MAGLKSKIGSVLFGILPFTRENLEIFRHEFRMLRVNVQNVLNPFAIIRRKKAIQGSSLSVNVGAGPFGQAGWVNIDIRMFPNISFTYDCRRKMPFRSHSVKRIRCEHVFEHLDARQEAPAFIKECLRVLEPGGVLRIVVPDLQKFIAAYVTKDKAAWAVLGWNVDHLPSDFYTPMDILNHTFRQDGEHKYGYDAESLEHILRRNGFSNIVIQQWGKSVDPELTNDLPNHQPYSLYVEAIKS